MSVDYYGCDCCGESVYEEYVWHCSECGHELCSWCLINKDGENSKYAYTYGVKCDGTQEQADEYGFELKDYKIGEVLDDIGIDSKHCPFCSGIKIHNDQLLEFAINKLGTTKEVLIEEYKKITGGEKLIEYLNEDYGTYGWQNAFTYACNNSSNEDLLKHCENLKWDEYDAFTEWISETIVAYITT